MKSVVISLFALSTASIIEDIHKRVAQKYQISTHFIDSNPGSASSSILPINFQGRSYRCYMPSSEESEPEALNETQSMEVKGTLTDEVGYFLTSGLTGMSSFT